LAPSAGAEKRRRPLSLNESVEDCGGTDGRDGEAVELDEEEEEAVGWIILKRVFTFVISFFCMPFRWPTQSAASSAVAHSTRISTSMVLVFGRVAFGEEGLVGLVGDEGVGETGLESVLEIRKS